MKKINGKLLIIYLFIFIINGCNKHANIFTHNKTYPILQGKSINFSKSAEKKNHKWLVINYWASWCPPCKKEIVELNRFSKNNSDKVTIVGVTLEPLTANKINKAIVDLDVQYPVVNSDIINDWLSISTEALPTTYIIDDNGKLVDVFSGPITYENLNNIIKSI